VRSPTPTVAARYGYAIASVAAALVAVLLLRPFDLEGFIFAIAVAAAVWLGGIGPGLVAVVLSVLVLHFVFIAPSDTGAMLPTVAYFTVFAVLALLITALSEVRHRAERSLRQARDVLEERVVERTAELERSRFSIRRQAALLDLAHDAIIVRDENDRVVFWNRGAEHTYGWTIEEASGRVLRELLQTKFPAPAAAIHAHVQRHGNWAGELTHVRRDGSTIVVASRWSLQRGEQDAAHTLMEINRDITDRKRAEAALHTAEAALAQVSRVTTLGEVTASFVHEVNQPLAAIVNNANACLGLLREGPEASEEIHSALEDVIGDAQRVSAIIERVRALARRSLGEKIPLRLADVVQDVIALAAGEAAARGVDIRTELAPDLPSVLGDRVQLQQVLLNLVINGMDAMSGMARAERVLVIGARPQTAHGGAAAAISVEDHGIGLDSADAQRLFEAFYTTKPHGMGMGLAISRSIIEAHGGRIWAEGNAGGGTTVSFTLPAVATS
jgi:PAS domain S-box-containing protein